MERLHPVEDGQVVREIIPGGHEPREFRLYPDHTAVNIARRLERSRFFPNSLLFFVDESVPVGADYLDRQPDFNGDVSPMESEHAA